jgi:hypothetical protein
VSKKWIKIENRLAAKQIAGQQKEQLIMDELVKAITEKTGLPEAQARQAAQVAVDFIKEKLPEPLAGQIDNILAGGGAEDLLKKGLGSLFGGKK